MRAWLIAPLFALSACGERETPQTAPAAPEPPAIQAGLSWTMTSSGEGAALRMEDGQGDLVMSIACLNDPARMRVAVPSFTPIASEERMSVGVDDDSTIFVAQLDQSGPGVVAEAPVTNEMLDWLPQANAVSVNYGAQNIGPHLPPSAEDAGLFVTACRDIAG